MKDLYLLLQLILLSSSSVVLLVKSQQCQREVEDSVVCNQKNYHCVRGDVLYFNSAHTYSDCHKLCRNTKDCRYFQYVDSNDYCTLFSSCYSHDEYTKEDDVDVHFSHVTCPLNSNEMLLRARCLGEIHYDTDYNVGYGKTYSSWSECRDVCSANMDGCNWFSYERNGGYCTMFSSCKWSNELSADYISGASHAKYKFNEDDSGDSSSSSSSSSSSHDDGYFYYLLYGYNGVVAVKTSRDGDNSVIDCHRMDMRDEHEFYRSDQYYVDRDDYNTANFLHQTNYPTVCGTVDESEASECAVFHPNSVDNKYQWSYVKEAINYPAYGSASSYIPGTGWWITGGRGSINEGTNKTTMLKFHEFTNNYHNDDDDDNYNNVRVQTEEGPDLIVPLKHHCQIQVSNTETIFIGGMTYDNFQYQDTDKVYSYDWVNDQWRTLASIPYSDSNNEMFCHMLPHSNNNEILVVVRNSDTSEAADDETKSYHTYVYNIDTDGWTQKADLIGGGTSNSEFDHAYIRNLFLYGDGRLTALMTFNGLDFNDEKDGILFMSYDEASNGNEGSWTMMNNALTGYGINSDSKYGVYPLLTLHECNLDYGKNLLTYNNHK